MPVKEIDKFLQNPMSYEISRIFSKDITRRNANRLVKAFTLNNSITYLHLSVDREATNFQIKCLINLIAGNKNLTSFSLRVRLGTIEKAKLFFSFLNNDRSFKIMTSNIWSEISMRTFSDVLSLKTNVKVLYLNGIFSRSVSPEIQSQILSRFLDKALSQKQLTSLLTNVTLNNFYTLGDKLIAGLLPGLRNNKTIRNLQLIGNAITDEGATKLASMLVYNTNIRSLNLLYNAIYNPGVIAFAKLLLVNNTLQHLDLFNWSDLYLNEDALSMLGRALQYNATLISLNSNGIERVVEANHFSADELDLRQKYLLTPLLENAHLESLGDIFEHKSTANTEYNVVLNNAKTKLTQNKNNKSYSLQKFMEKREGMLELVDVSIGPFLIKLVQVLIDTRIKALTLINNEINKLEAPCDSNLAKTLDNHLPKTESSDSKFTSFSLFAQQKKIKLDNEELKQDDQAPRCWK